MLTKLGYRWINSVLKLSVTQAKYDVIKPYNNPEDVIVEGNGFIVDLEKGLVLTTARLVQNALSILATSFRTGKRTLSLDLLSMCKERDIALCKINHEDINLIVRGLKKEELKKLNIRFGDSMFVNIGEETMIMGYHNTSIVQFKNTNILGFISNNSQTEDSYIRNPSYIEVSNYIPGTGGILLNMKGNLIGIQSIDNKFISSRSLLSVFPKLLNTSEVLLPTLSLDWCKTNREIMERTTGTPNTYGIYVRNVGTDSCFNLLQRGDIIKRIDFEDIFWKSSGESNDVAFDINNYIKNADKKDNDGIKSTLITVLIDRFGMTYRIGKLKDPEKYEDKDVKYEKMFSNRNLGLDQLMDIIPLGANISVNLCRDGQWYNLKSEYNFVQTDRIMNHNKLDYEIFAGLCCTELSKEHLEIFNLNQKESNIIITHTFPYSTNHKIGILQPGFIIKSILGYDSEEELIKDTHRPIKDIEDVRHILRLQPYQLQITTKDNSILIIKTEIAVKEDRIIMSTYNINHNYLLG